MVFEAKIHGCEIKQAGIDAPIATAPLTKQEQEAADRALKEAQARIRKRAR